MPPNNPKEFALALISLKRDFAIRDLYGKNSISLSKSEFSRKKLSNTFVKFLLST